MIVRALTTLWKFQVDAKDLDNAEQKLNAIAGAFNKVSDKTASGIKSLWDYKKEGKEASNDVEVLTKSLNDHEDQVKKSEEKTEALTKKIKSQKISTDEAIKSFENFSNVLKGGVILYLGELAARIGTVWAFVNSTAAVANKVAKTADMLGIGVEALQEYRYAAQRSGVAQDTLDASLKSFVIRVGEASQGTGEAISCFKELGIALKDSSGNLKKPDLLLSEIADKMAAIEDPTTRARIAMKLFETEGVELVNILKLGSKGVADLRREARNLGLIVSERDTRNAESFNNSITMLFGVIRGITNKVSAGLFPALTRLANKWRDFIIANRQLIKSGIDKFLSQTVIWLQKTSDSIFYFIEASRKAISSLGGLSNIADVLQNALIVLAAGFTVLKYEMIAAQVAALAMPILIASTVLAIALLIQDVQKWVNGAGSAIGDLIGNFSDFKEMVRQNFYLEPLNKLKNALSRILTVYLTLKSVLSSGWDLFTSDSDENPLKKPAAFVNNQGLENSASNMLANISPRTNPLPKPQLFPVDQRSIKNDFNMTVNAAPGQSPSEIGLAVKNEYINLLREMEERNNRDSKNEIEY